MQRMPQDDIKQFVKAFSDQNRQIKIAHIIDGFKHFGLTSQIDIIEQQLTKQAKGRTTLTQDEFSKWLIQKIGNNQSQNVPLSKLSTSQQDDLFLFYSQGDLKGINEASFIKSCAGLGYHVTPEEAQSIVRAISKQQKKEFISKQDFLDVLKNSTI